MLSNREGKNDEITKMTIVMSSTVRTIKIFIKIDAPLIKHQQYPKQVEKWRKKCLKRRTSTFDK